MSMEAETTQDAITSSTEAATSAEDVVDTEIGRHNEKTALREAHTDKTKHRDEEPKPPPRKCGCTCKISCNCRCTCSCRDHCVCRLSPWDGQCGTRVSRNLVVSTDGTSNQFGIRNTNVVELHSRVLTDTADQNKYYNCGIGTYVPYENQTSWKYWRQRLGNGLDLAFALNFKDIILKAYRWLSQTYKSGDKIYFFGFSRGAYQVRTLAGMIETVGLIDTGNEELVPFAYEFYLERHKGVVTKEATEIAAKFKKTFSRDVRVHFVGVWDTVSSVGVFRGKPLPLTSSAGHICTFRHALALDERRVKFLPEYVEGGSSTFSTTGAGIDVKEVWFAGTHSDIGGGVKKNLDLNSSSVPLLWMENEATAAGLRLKPRDGGGVWKVEDLRKDDVHESLTDSWKPLEYLPLTRLSFQTPDETTATPHLGSGRIIVPGQRIHISVAFKSKDYRPRANFLRESSIKWDSFIGKEFGRDDFEWARSFGDEVEMDLFDGSFTFEAFQKLRNLWAQGEQETQDGTEHLGSQASTYGSESYWIERLAFMVLSGQLAANYLSELEPTSPDKTVKQVHAAVELFEKLQTHRPHTFDADVAALLEREARLLVGLGQKTDALQTYRKAEILRRKLATEEKTRTADIGNLARCLENIFWRCSDLGMFNEALVSIEETVKLRRLIRSRDEAISNSAALGYSLNSLGNALSNVKRHDALRVDEEAVELRHKLAETDPNLTKDLAQSSHNLGVDLSKVKGEAVQLHRKLTETNPNAAKGLAESLHNLGVELSRLGRHEDALRANEEAVEIRRKLAETDPNVIKHLSNSLHNLGVEFSRLGRHEDALRADEEAVDIWRKLAETDTTATGALASSLYEQAYDLRVIGRHKDALRACEEAIEIHRKLAETDNTVTGDLATSLYDQAYNLRVIGRHEDALRADEEAAGLRRNLMQAGASVEEDLGRSLENVVLNLNAIGRHEDAVRTGEEAVALYEKLPDSTARSGHVANTLKHLAVYLHAVGHHEDTLRADEKGAEMHHKLRKTDPSLTARSFHVLAEDFHTIGLHEDALRAEEEAVELYREITTQSTHRPALLRERITSLELFAKILRALGRAEDAARTDAEVASLERGPVDVAVDPSPSLSPIRGNREQAAQGEPSNEGAGNRSSSQA
ncbi:hypothetical protein DFH07DRAFT_7752 [Mycena maculata]|uniref:T6SS Phospholipase effector Tle1-like catalytic domain-containing protein n=1 Tax=Mycena maculata TaxID=230809 RepID=A0AAD7P2V8_9AGAR|nr:hypothetical protein DFH07DRAFT_7752 [Mycena maculata]